MENKVSDIELCNFRVGLVLSEDVKCDGLFQFFTNALRQMDRVVKIVMEDYFSQRNK